MRILLTTLNSKFIHSNLALRYLYSVAGRYRDQMEIDEYTINHTDDYIFTELMRKDSKLYCFSCYIWNIERTLYLAQTLKQAKPNVKILLGGPEVSYEGEEFLFQNPYVDYVIQGEGEGAFSAFLKQYFATMPDYDSVWGLLYRSGAIVRKNKPCPPLKFESVPNPYELLPAEEDKILYYESSRGCPFNCAYCLSCIERQVRALPLERVKEDLKYFIYKRVKQVKFVDRTFNFDARRSLEIMKYLIEKDNGITNYHLELCGELMTEEHFALLSQARPGLFQFEIGVQSTHPSTLNAINRRGNFDKIAETVRRIQAIGGIHLHLDLIAGLPLEDYNLFRHSFNDVYGLQPDALQVGFLKLLKGTPLREDARLYGYVYRQKAPYEVITNSYISADGLVRIKM
ncbi:MAG: radical SAM protein, partial [Eubacteriales bacterium]|nr:radical SAM protein [Eubacteriales bacterium]